MQTILTALIVFIWLGGALLRIYKQARFYQIEEYMSKRYLRWLFSERARFLPSRPVIAWFIGSAIGVVMGEAPNSALGHVIASVAAIIGIWPPDEGEIKRKFVRTQRATRLLGASFALTIALVGGLLFTASRLPLPKLSAMDAIIAGFIGLIAFLLAPIALVAGNILMTPVEAFFRRRFVQQAKDVMRAISPTVIGITGSYGKTTTKTFLKEILSARYKVYATPKSYNTMMGVCIAINRDLAQDYSIEYFISEMGAYIPGEIRRLCGLTPPHISIVVEVGPQHLERFGSLENIAIAKYEIIKGLQPEGLGVFNWDNPYVRAMYERGYPNNRIAVSTNLAPDNVPAGGPRFIASNIEESLDGLEFDVTDVQTGQQEHFSTPIVGRHNVLNLLLATAVAVYEGLSLREVALRVRLLQPAESRLVRQTTSSGITIINDSYSANPVGIVSALNVLAMHRTGRRLLITPGMVELGDLHDSENRKLGEYATKIATDIILVGERQTKPIREGVIGAGFPQDRLLIVDTLSEAVKWYQSHLKAGDTVLFLNDLPDTY